MPTRIDHIVIAVRNLATATADYTRAGFTVVQGGEHKDGMTHNALVAFADGVYFELIAFIDPDREIEHKWWHGYSLGEGLIDYALRTDDLTKELRELRARRLSPTDPIDGGRFRPDGERLDWQTIRFEGDSSPAMPFYCFDLTDRRLRVPYGDAAFHGNGVTGVAGVTVLVGDFTAMAPMFQKLTATDGVPLETATLGAQEARRFQFGNSWIEAVQPSSHDSDQCGHLDLRGDSVFSVTLSVPSGGTTAIPHELVHGARFILESTDVDNR